MANENIRHRSTTGTRLTPLWLLDLCVEVMGSIDLDPCSEPGPPFNVPAKVHWTKNDDCLTQDAWLGNVFLNPPYGKKRGVEEILRKLDSEYMKRNVQQACALLPVDTSTGWWSILGYVYPWCAFAKRIKFDQLKTGAGYPSALFYLGHIEENRERFMDTFSRVGQIYVPIH